MTTSTSGGLRIDGKRIDWRVDACGVCGGRIDGAAAIGGGAAGCDERAHEHRPDGVLVRHLGR